MGILGYIAGKGTATPSVGLSIQPKNAAKRGRLSEFTCGFTTTYVVGEAPATKAVNEKGGGDSVIVSIAPVDEMSAMFTNRASQTETANIPSHFEGKRLDVLEAEPKNALEDLPWASAALEFAYEANADACEVESECPPEPLEIKA
jgi:hypothetical protein